jgi:hypothetical protein
MWTKTEKEQGMYMESTSMKMNEWELLLIDGRIIEGGKYYRRVILHLSLGTRYQISAGRETKSG